MRICFIWHMHQPYYKDLKGGEYLLPWVRLHGVKDYLDMVKMLEGFPGVRQCFNLVPSLLEQIQDYADGNAQDRHLYLSAKKPKQLSREEKLEISEDFFSAHLETMIHPYPRYYDLYRVCQEPSRESRLQRLSEQDILDLQVWSNAVWIDPSLRKDPRARRIFAKGRGFTEAEKRDLLSYQIELLSRIIPAYRDMRERGAIEVSFSPYYHPILPLLIDTDSAKIAMPDIMLPHQRFVHPEDAEQQVRSAVQLYESLFGSKLTGMWPSEGSVSDEVIPLLAKEGIKWIATDQEIYFASAGMPADSKTTPASGNLSGLYRPYRVGGDNASVGIIFRDHYLSDRIGFVYQSWDPEKAAADFLGELHNRAGAAMQGGNPDPVVSIILDGENAWEYYQNDGIDFLKALYSQIEADKSIETVLPQELFEDSSEMQKLPHLFAGSWINHNFRVWIGHEEDNRAWDLLKLTRDRLVVFLEHHADLDPAKREMAWKEIYIAEGSDWCWWYGDEHQTAQFHLFDQLFRKHLQNVWEIIDTPPPVELAQPIRRQSKQIDYTEPRDWLTPTIDGRETHFFEWFAAGRLECFKQGGAMQRAERVLKQLLFGYDREKVYLRLDFEKGIDPVTMPYGITIEFFTGKRYQVHLTSDSHDFVAAEAGAGENLAERIEVGRGNIIELAVPRDLFTFVKEKVLFVGVTICLKEKEVEKWPATGYIGFRLPNPEETLFWEL
jgi:alpha-amylase/alpha-mannosidase (GH57 family)